MVYRGKLSKACAECRARKTRCDAAKPGCGQCRRAGRKCSGYRNLAELRLVDQSFEVSSKLSNNRPATTFDFAVGASPCSSETIPEVNLTLTPPSSSPSYSDENNSILTAIPAFSTPSLWAEGIAESVFVAQFLTVPGHFPKHDLGFVKPIRNDTSNTGMLESIMSALGLAVILKTHNDQSLQMLATQKYASSLKQMQSALQRPKLAKSDETIATVLLLSLHELITSEDPETDYQRHSVHLQGAIKLLQLRGQAQMDHHWGSRMLHRVCDQVSGSCLYSRTPVPPNLLRLVRSFSHKMHQEEKCVSALFGLCARLCEILHLDLNELDSEPDVESTLRKLIGVDEALAEWPATLSWRFDIQHFQIESPDKSFLQEHDSYLNHITATSWNRFRSVRIKCAEEIIRLSELLPSSSPFRHTVSPSINTLSTMTREICQSVPFFFGEHGTCWSWQDKVAEPPTMYSASTMLMPLYFATGNPQHISPTMQEWLLGQIRRIADLGVAKAKQILEERRAQMPQPKTAKAWYED